MFDGVSFLEAGVLGFLGGTSAYFFLWVSGRLQSRYRYKKVCPEKGCTFSMKTNDLTTYDRMIDIYDDHMRAHQQENYA